MSGFHFARPTGAAASRMVPAALLLALLLGAMPTARADTREEIALSLAEMLRSARTVISANQALINDPAVGDKGLSGDVVLQKTRAKYSQATSQDPGEIDPNSLHGKLLRALMASITEVMDENQPLLNEQGVAFKAFLPATFARLVTERFRSKAGADAVIKVTGPDELVRNRSARPDRWEQEQIESVLLRHDYPKGQHFAMVAEDRGRRALRVLIPEYYTESCLACHGGPKGEPDITGYPKEGGRVGDLGSVISITIFD
ncbi:Tll0287-like domain-containing protein [Virgifigura deserti]|uniref:Tll0287-like domain-containing protein n=1 Tax=Virgifigura deserti TaxID=2268457 RepID=UPI003CCC2E81